MFAGQRGVEQAAAGEQDDHDPDRGGDHVLRVPDADGRDDADRFGVRAARADARVLREPRAAHHLQLPDGGERGVQLHAVLRDEPQVPAHADGHVHAVPGRPARAQRHAPVFRQLPAVRYYGPAQHRGHADDRHRQRTARVRQTGTARGARQQQDGRHQHQLLQQRQADHHRRRRCRRRRALIEDRPTRYCNIMIYNIIYIISTCIAARA